DPFYRYDSAEEMERDLETALDPSRFNEEKYTVPMDDDATKAIPNITKERPYENLDETIVRGKEQITKTINKPAKKEDSPKKKSRGKKWTVILVSIFLLLIILGISAVTILPDILAPDDVEIPPLANIE